MVEQAHIDIHYANPYVDVLLYYINVIYLWVFISKSVRQNGLEMKSCFIFSSGKFWEVVEVDCVHCWH